MKRQCDDGVPSARPWRIEHTSKLKGAVIKGADDAVVAVCHADNAALIVEAVNAYEQFISPTAGRAGSAETAEARDGNPTREGVSR